MNADLLRLQPYPFEKLKKLLHGISPPAEKPPIVLSIGEPQQATPEFIRTALAQHLDGLARYPATLGALELRQAIADWLEWRYALPAQAIDPNNQVLPVNGTREALFAIAQAMVQRAECQAVAWHTRSTDAKLRLGTPLVVMPNPFYQIYEGAALLAGAQPWFLPATEATGLLPDFDAVPAAVWQRCQLLYVCSPANPTGAVIALEPLQRLIQLAREFDFIIAADECYSELYPDEAPPPGLLQAAWALGEGLNNCLVFNSLSKRSSAPGLRSGFVAGDANLIRQFLLYRTYHGSATPLPTQLASVQAWQDEAHVRAARAAYQQKFAATRAILAPVWDMPQPAGGFYYWLRTPVDGETFARELFRQENVTVLPGSYLSRPMADGSNPGQDYVRIALVAPLESCATAACAIARVATQLA